MKFSAVFQSIADRVERRYNPYAEPFSNELEPGAFRVLISETENKLQEFEKTIRGGWFGRDTISFTDRGDAMRLAKDIKSRMQEAFRLLTAFEFEIKLSHESSSVLEGLLSYIEERRQDASIWGRIDVQYDLIRTMVARWNAAEQLYVRELDKIEALENIVIKHNCAIHILERMQENIQGGIFGLRIISHTEMKERFDELQQYISDASVMAVSSPFTSAERRFIVSVEPENWESRIKNGDASWLRRKIERRAGILRETVSWSESEQERIRRRHRAIYNVAAMNMLPATNQYR